MDKMLYSKSTTGSRSVALFLVALMIFSTSLTLLAPKEAKEEVLMEDSPVIFKSGDTQQTYDLYLAKKNDTHGGKGTITTL
ncbi:MAG TPA: hypothetical protein QGI72_05010, partial [Poseidonia sp.]|nr:hypothetical protein [Poseidonia sp.]